MYTILGGFGVHYDDAGQGTPLLLMHAFPLDRRMFFAIPGARLITFDAPGAGESPVPERPVTMDALADLAADLLDHLGVRQAVVGGVSMGGYAAFRFAARHRDRLLALLLGNTRAAADGPEARRARFEMIDAVRRLGPAEIARRMVPRLLGETTRRDHPALVDRVSQMIRAAPAEGIARLLEGLADRPDSTPVLPAISVPTVVLTGDEDVIATPAESSQWAAAIPGARFSVIRRCGHLSTMEQPAAFERALVAGLGGQFGIG